MKCMNRLFRHSYAPSRCPLILAWFLLFWLLLSLSSCGTVSGTAVLTSKDGECTARLVQAWCTEQTFCGSIQIQCPPSDGEPDTVYHRLAETYQPMLTLPSREPLPLAITDGELNQRAEQCIVTFSFSMPIVPFPDSGTLGEITIPGFQGSFQYKF